MEGRWSRDSKNRKLIPRVLISACLNADRKVPIERERLDVEEKGVTCLCKVPQKS